MADPAPANSGDTAAELRPDGRPRGRPFQAGQSGNPTGRPKGLSASVRRVLEQAAQEAAAKRGDPEPERADGAEILVRLFAGIAGDAKARNADRIAAGKVLAAYGWGQPPEHVPVEGADPLGLEEERVEDAAREFDARVVRLAERRAARPVADGASP